MPWAASDSIFSMLNDPSAPKVSVALQHQAEPKDRTHKRAKV